MDNDRINIERELWAAMAKRVTALPPPRIDLAAIRRKRATWRRVMVPVIATALALLSAAPFAGAARWSRSDMGNAVTSTLLPTTTSSPTTTAQTTPDGHRVVPGIGGQPGSSLGSSQGPQGGGQGPGASLAPGSACVRLRAPLTTAERSALGTQAQAVMEQAQADLRGALSGAGLGTAVGFSGGVLDGLLPEVGELVDQVDCDGQRSLDAAQRRATLDQLRAAVLSSGLVTGVVMDRTSGLLGLLTGKTSGTVGFAQATSGTLSMVSTIKGQGLLLPYQRTMPVVMRRSDGGVTRLDLTNLGLLGGLDLGDLSSTLDGLTSGLQGVVPGILAPGATILQ